MASSTIVVSESAEVSASPEQVYAVIADYRNGHPYILPEDYFSDLQVESGGVGAGTIIRFRMKIFGQSREFRQQVSEPEPGRVLVEMDLASSARTVFLVDPLDGGKRSKVTITTHIPASTGIQGMIERWLIPPTFKKIYSKELAKLETYVLK